jgi:hypothetical protein
MGQVAWGVLVLMVTVVFGGFGGFGAFGLAVGRSGLEASLVVEAAVVAAVVECLFSEV